MTCWRQKISTNRNGESCNVKMNNRSSGNNTHFITKEWRFKYRSLDFFPITFKKKVHKNKNVSIHHNERNSYEFSE